VALVGESACGKSVSAMSIIASDSLSTGVIVGGEILFDGKDLFKTSEEEMRENKGEPYNNGFPRNL